MLNVKIKPLVLFILLVAFLLGAVALVLSVAISANKDTYYEQDKTSITHCVDFANTNVFTMGLAEPKLLSGVLFRLRPGDTTINVCHQLVERYNEDGENVLSQEGFMDIVLSLYKYDELAGSEFVQQITLCDDIPNAFSDLSDMCEYFIVIEDLCIPVYETLQVYRDPIIINGIVS